MTETTASAPIIVSREFFERRHPAYAELLDQWMFFYSCYRGGRSWFDDNVFRYYKEGDREFKDRIKRAYRFNHSREVVDLVQKYLFKAKIARNTDTAPDMLKQFWNSATRSGLSIDQLMRNASTSASIGGRIAVVVDNNKPNVVDAEASLSEKQVEESNAKIYAYTVMPWDVLDYAWDEDGDGELLWIKLREYVRDDSDPHNSSGLTETRVRLWTRTEWYLYQEQDVETTQRGTRKNSVEKTVVEKKIVQIGSGRHNLGFVPVKLFDHILTGEAYRSTGLIDDIAYLDRAVANYLSNLDAIIQDQTFSQLAIPAQSLPQGSDMFDRIVEMGTKRVFTYDGGAGSTSEPKFISPDPKQAGVIVSVIEKIINEIYHTIGLAGERTKQDNAVGIDNSSGVAKAYDFERVNSLLLAKAQSCEHLENWICNTVIAWAGVTASKEKLVTYPTTFDIARLGDELATAEALGKVEAPIELRREQMNAIVDKLFPQISVELRSALRAAIQKWETTVEKTLKEPVVKPGDTSQTSVQGSRQGEVTKNT
jgi:hypothetical protein